ncbi:hypothetical protein [Kordiimonas sp.]|uniref:hypothetical protein n=1 Tax=Kordiimonas sp. TaxID=1970157 RepID=UPI003A94C32F
MKLQKHLGGGASRLAAIWSEINSPEGLPDRRDFTLPRLGSLASCFLVLQQGEGDTLTVVQSGTAIDHIWGRNVVGAQSGSLALRPDVDLADEKALTALSLPCGIHLGRALLKASGNRLTHETLYLPVTSNHGRQLVSVTDFADKRDMYGLLGDTSPVIGGEMYFAYFVDVGLGLPGEGNLRVA